MRSSELAVAVVDRIHFTGVFACSATDSTESGSAPRARLAVPVGSTSERTCDARGAIATEAALGGK